MRRCLIIRPGAIGDAIVTLPAAQRLRESGAQVHLVVGGSAAELLRGRCAAEVVSSFDEARWAALFAPALPAEMRAFLEGFAAILVYLADAASPLVLPLRSLATRVVLWPAFPATPQPIALHLQEALNPLGLAAEPCWPSIRLTAADIAFAEGFWRDQGLPVGSEIPVIALHPGSGSPRKNWPAERYAALAARLARERHARLLVVAGPADEAAWQVLRGQWADEPPLVLESRSLAQVGALLARCHLLIGNDSGIAHLSAALGVPTLALFGPTDPRVWAPQGPRAAVIAPERPSDGGLASLTVERAYKEALALLARGDWPPGARRV